MQDENLIKPIDPPFSIDWIESVEEHRRELARLFHIDAALLGDPFAEPAYVTAERIRRRSMQELRERMEALNVTEEQAAEEASTQGSSEESKG